MNANVNVEASLTSLFLAAHSEICFNRCTANCRTSVEQGKMARALKKSRNYPRAIKAERVEARLSPEQKRRIEHAASLKGTSISDFMVLSADEAAMRTIHEYETWVLTGKDREAFIDALLHPPAPNERMRAAAQRYKNL